MARRGGGCTRDGADPYASEGSAAENFRQWHLLDGMFF